MNIDQLIEFADKQKVDEKSIKDFAARIEKREKKYKEHRRKQLAATQKFMARSYTL